MDMQNVSNLVIPEGEVRTIHDKDSRLLWSRVNYNVKYLGDAAQQTYSGKNIYLIPESGSKNNITFINNGGKSFSISSSAAASATSNFTIRYPKTPIGEAGDTVSFTLSTNKPLPTGCNIYISARSDTAWVQDLMDFIGNGTRTSITRSKALADGITTFDAIVRVTSGSIVNISDVTVQVEIGTTATDYEPYVGGVPAPNPDYPQDIDVVTGTQTIRISDGTNSHNYTVNLGSTELCKIGNYQDYIYKSGDDWYIHKNVGKAMFSGLSSESWSVQNSGTANYFYKILSYPYGANSVALSNNFIRTPITGSNTSVGFSLNNNDEFRFRPNYSELSITDWEAWLGLHNTTVYYILATPTDTKIAGSTLIGQLNAVHQFLTRYGYSATVSGNLPLIIYKTNL